MLGPVTRILILVGVALLVGGCFPLFGPCEPWPMGLNCL